MSPQPHASEMIVLFGVLLVLIFGGYEFLNWYWHKRFGTIKRMNSLGDHAVDVLFGTPEAWTRYYMERQQPEGDMLKIVGAAVRHPSGVIFMAEQPGRHHHVFRVMILNRMAGMRNTCDQGFMTSRYQFVDRIRGLRIATAADQIIFKHPADWELYSEDMWETPHEEPNKERDNVWR